MTMSTLDSADELLLVAYADEEAVLVTGPVTD